jgi:hypothetical protein
MTGTRQRTRFSALGLTMALVCALLLTACGEEKKVETAAMPSIVGMTVGAGERLVYDVLHTSLVYYDQSPADRDSTNDWIIVSTFPAADAVTPTKKIVYAWALKRSEYDWFKAHPTMPKLPAKATLAKLVGPGGALAGVSELVKLRYQPGKAPQSAKPDPKDANAFTPDRGVRPDPSTEPAAELELRKTLMVAKPAGTIAVGSRPAPGATLRVGQYVVILAITKPPAKKKPIPGNFDYDPPDLSGVGGGGSGGSGGGGGGGGIPGLPGIDIPNIPCPKQICS